MFAVQAPVALAPSIEDILVCLIFGPRKSEITKQKNFILQNS